MLHYTLVLDYLHGYVTIEPFRPTLRDNVEVVSIPCDNNYRGRINKLGGDVAAIIFM